MSGSHAIQAQADAVRATIAHVKQLTVDRLKRVLKHENLQVSGVKSELQTRLIAHIYDCDRKNDLDRIQRIQNVVRGYYPGTQSTNTYNSPNPYPSPYSNHTPVSSASPQNYLASPTLLNPSPSIATMPTNTFGQSRVSFKNSPFYIIERQLGTTVELRPRETTRDTARLTINLDHVVAQEFQSNSSCRAMVFCAMESFDNQWKPAEIAFPHHAELRCNQDDVKVNLKGLKNKPGSTRPVDITPFLRKKAGFPNTVELVYALTNKKYFLVVNKVHKRSIQFLVDDLKRGKYLSKDRVIREMRSRAEDDDIVATSSNMSLKDPVQMTRIETPCRGMSCKHNECFDAAVYLALQEQAPTWTCPVCSKPAPYDSLVYDLFVQDILENAKSDVDQVTIEPDGQWHHVREEEEPVTRANENPFALQANGYHHDEDNNDDDDDDDDDLVEITDLEASKSVASIRTRPSNFAIRTPPINNREASFPLPQASSSSFAQSTHNPQSQSRKRPREENVIDLTLSDDDDEPPAKWSFRSI